VLPSDWWSAPSHGSFSRCHPQIPRSQAHILDLPRVSIPVFPLKGVLSVIGILQQLLLGLRDYAHAGGFTRIMEIVVVSKYCPATSEWIA
jgi:hypothetical protein